MWPDSQVGWAAPHPYFQFGIYWCEHALGAEKLLFFKQNSNAFTQCCMKVIHCLKIGGTVKTPSMKENTKAHSLFEKTLVPQHVHLAVVHTAKGMARVVCTSSYWKECGATGRQGWALLLCTVIKTYKLAQTLSSYIHCLITANIMVDHRVPKQHYVYQE